MGNYGRLLIIILLVLTIIVLIVLASMGKIKINMLSNTIHRKHLSNFLKDKMDLSTTKIPMDYRSLPENYDLRDTNRLSVPLNQEDCGSCWAFAIASTLSDRVKLFSEHMIKPIHLKEKQVVNQLSPYILASCDFCDQLKHPEIRNLLLNKKECNQKCDGGIIQYGYIYLHDNGLFTMRCNPAREKYTCVDDLQVKKIDPKDPKSDIDLGPCYHWSFGEPYQINIYDDLDTQDKLAENTRAIKVEIFKNGPVTAGMMVYSSFYDFFEKNPHGVYRGRVGSEAEISGHAIELIGWGHSENNEPYWIVKNSWSEDWGDKGYFKIIMGSNVCDIETDVWASVPLIEDSVKKLIQPGN